VTGLKVVSTKGLPFTLNRWYFFFTFKRNLLLKLQKNGFSVLSQNMWLVNFSGLPAANNLKQQANQLIVEIGMLLFR
jgi:hypothetical protein